MKITFVPHGYSPKPIGGLKVVYEYANLLVARGHEVTVVHPDRLPNLVIRRNRLDRLRLWLNRNKREPRYSIVPPEVHWHQIDSRVRMLYVPLPTPSYIPNSDAVFATFWATAEYLLNYPEEKGKKFYFIQSYDIWAGPKDRVDAIWRSSMEKIVVSRGLYEQGLKLGIPANEMVHIPNGIDHDKYRILRPIGSRPPRIAMLYNPFYIKGAAEGIRALELARNTFPGLQAVLFGIFPKPKELPGWIEYQHDPPQEELVGGIYNGSSIYLCPSWHEGFGLPPAEAMACGCAVVSTDSEGVRDFAEHEVTALLSPPKYPEPLAANIIRLLRDDELRIRLAKAGHERIQEFTWERSINLFERFMKDKIRQ